MKIENEIKYIEIRKDWEKVTRADKVIANEGLQEGFFFGKRYLPHSGTKLIQKEFPILIRREINSIIEDVVGEAIIVHDQGVSGDYDKLDKFLRTECNA